MKINYIVIPLITVATSVIGSVITGRGMDWYKTIKLPAWTPPGSFIGAVWTVLFVLATISALIFWSKHQSLQSRQLITALFIVNAIANVGWSYLFFGEHLIKPAIIEAGFLGLTCVALIVALWPISTAAALLIVPYAAWVGFATYLTYVIWSLNR